MRTIGRLLALAALPQARRHLRSGSERSPSASVSD